MIAKLLYGGKIFAPSPKLTNVDVSVLRFYDAMVYLPDLTKAEGRAFFFFVTVKVGYFPLTLTSSIQHFERFYSQLVQRVKQTSQRLLEDMHAAWLFVSHCHAFQRVGMLCFGKTETGNPIQTETMELLSAKV